MFPEVEGGASAPETPVAAPQATPVLDPTAGQVEENQQEADPPEKMLPQSEVNKLIAKEKAKEARRTERAIRAEVERDLLRQQLDARDRPQAQPQPQGMPKEEDFAGRPYREYVEALTDWKVDQRIAKERDASKERDATQNRQRADAENYRHVHENIIAKGQEKYADFVDVVTAVDGITEPMLASASYLPNGADVLYHLSGHDAERLRIAAMRPVQQAFALKDLSAKLSAPPKPTSAPPPIVPNKPNASVEKRLEDADVDEFFAIRKRQLAAKKGR